MSEVILVKHSLPEVEPGRPAQEWQLGEEGRRRALVLGERLAAYEPEVVITSVEAKAHETGEIVGQVLGKPVVTAEGLHEHDRSNVPFLGKEAFEAAVADFFVRPGELVLGLETADQVWARFYEAIQVCLAKHAAAGTVVIVTHGTVMSLLIGRTNGLEPMAIWRELGLPSFVVLVAPGFALLSSIENI